MSVSDFVLHHDEFMSSYFGDCAKYNVNSIPIEERQHVSVGILFVAIGILCQMLYIPCLYAIYLQIKLNRFATCYKFMFYLGIVDTIGLMITGPFCGVASIQGLVYCQRPVSSYIVCVIGFFGWFAANTTTLILAINRCMVLYDDHLADQLFKGRRGTMWLILPTMAGFVGVWVSPALYYNPIDSSALFNPHRHYLPDEPIFHSAAHVTFNWIIVLAIPSIYITFAVFFANRLRSGGMLSLRNNRKLARELSTFLQVLITSTLVVSTSLGFIYQEYLKSFPIFVFVGYIMYQGSPAFIYLCMNQSIRNTLLSKSSKIYQSSNVAPSNAPPTRDQNVSKNDTAT
ncbi:serpentine type 7TM GPCR chemoreceptor srt domain-containing protein [Ditylenchus destructor]|uniref:Serpentine type 7TM GPCR chemoreceptor srt domain-containing protein n=1 Tax=Ditylenchus destructor TaxID=166010 RepID=A0AAD4R100_9BILA|nr:serpentine type 7TM GPCR chemoreceptor srt domain-containing protein [Ditylenchus destructor]